MVTAVDHFTINVVDRDASLRFYGELLGLGEPKAVDMGTQMMYYFKLPGGALLELIDYVEDTGRSSLPPVTRGMPRHIAFRTDDIQAACDKLKAAGVEITAGPGRLEQLGCHYFLFRDPNGCELEFVSRP